MTIDKLMREGELVAMLKAKTNGGLARIYACKESRGYQTDFRPKRFFFFVPFSTANNIPLKIIGITRDARRKNIPLYSDVNIVNNDLWQDFMN
jgi:hypothetical protein